jgi:hypothetical protein
MTRHRLLIFVLTFPWAIAIAFFIRTIRRRNLRLVYVPADREAYFEKEFLREQRVTRRAEKRSFKRITGGPAGNAHQRRIAKKLSESRQLG